MNDIPFGYCECGCGQKTDICKWPDKRRGLVKGQPNRFARGHTSQTKATHIGIRYQPNICACGCGAKTALDEYGWPREFLLSHHIGIAPKHKGERWVAMPCECGCGELAPLHRNGWTQDFISGHQNRKTIGWEERDCRYKTPCWVWTGTIDSTGYGSFTRNKVKHEAHRWSWNHFRGEIPKGLYVCHKCDNPPCIRPDHLFLGTHRDNMRDMKEKGRGYNVGKGSGAKNPRRGERHPKAVLTDDLVRELCHRYAAGGISERKLAKEYGLQRGVVRAAITRRTWKHVDI